MLSADVERYVALRRRVGLKLVEPARVLRLYAAHVATKNEALVRTDNVVSWSKRVPGQRAARRRYDIICRFAAFLHLEDPRHEVPPPGLLGRGTCVRPTPHIYAPGDIERIMLEALEQGPPGSICPKTYHHLFGLLASTGLRISEALGLRMGDVTADGLLIERAKYDKPRLVPLHASVRRALEGYLDERRRVATASDEVFIVSHGRAPTKTRVHVVFVEILRRLGLRGPTGVPGPRLHDLRHTFAVRSLEQCPHDPTAVSQHLIALSTYLGHSSPDHTYWYLEATPVLLRRIAEASERQSGRDTA